jgi:hypothetical protein
MTAGLLLVLCIGLPAIAALVIAGLGADSRFESIVSTGSGIFTLLVAVVVAVLLTSSKTPNLQARIVITGWKLTPDEAAPTMTFHLTRPWAFAPTLAAACALVLISANENRPWHVHLQHAAVQGSLVAPTPELGLAMVTASTIGAAMSLSASPDNVGTRGPAIALRWAAADVVLWMWTAGFLGVGTAISRIAAVALMVRASAFPFQGALARSVSDIRESGLLFVPFPAIIWAIRWMDADVVPNSLLSQVLIAAMVLIPAVLGWASRNIDAATAYRLTSVILWPLALSLPTANAIGLIGLGIASGHCRHLIWLLIAGAASVAVPTLPILAMARTGELPSSQLIGLAAVSLSAILNCSAPRKPEEEVSAGGIWREAVLVTVSLSALLTAMSFGGAATVDP